MPRRKHRLFSLGSVLHKPLENLASRLESSCLLMANQSVEVAVDAVHQFACERSLHHTTAQRPGHRPTRSTAVRPVVDTIDCPGSGSYTDAELCNLCTTKLPSTALVFPAVLSFHLAPSLSSALAPPNATWSAKRSVLTLFNRTPDRLGTSIVRSHLNCGFSGLRYACR